MFSIYTVQNYMLYNIFSKQNRLKNINERIVQIKWENKNMFYNIFFRHLCGGNTYAGTGGRRLY